MTHFEPATDAALANIKKFNNALNNFAKLSDGEFKEWYFDPNSVEKITNQFNQERIRFKVYDPDVDFNFTWDSPIGAARQVLPFLEKGQYFLRVERHGEGRDTRYAVSAITPVTGEDLNPNDERLSP